MASYRIAFKPSVERDLRSLPKSIVARIWAGIEKLSDNPFPRQSVKLAGTEKLYRFRVGEYRIVYGVDTKSRKITVHYVRHRKDVYREM